MVFDNLIYRNKLSLFLSTVFIGLTLGVIRRLSKLFPNKNGEVLIIALHKLGDTVFTIPTISILNKYFEKRITIVCFRESLPIFRIKFNNVGYIILEHNDFYFRNRIANKRAKRQIKLSNPEIIIDLTGELTSTSLIYSSKAKQIFGLTKKHFAPVYDKYVNIEFVNHITEQYLNVVKLINPTLIDNILEEGELGFFPIETILIHPFAGWSAKEWSLNKFILLAIELQKLYKVKIIVPSNYLAQDIINEIFSAKIEIIFTDTIEELISSLKECSLLICNDSGPIQIASILGRYTFSVYGPTNPLIHKPQGVKHGFYFKQINCSPRLNEKMCFSAGGRVGCPSNECLKQIEVKDMYIAIDYFIKNLKLNIFTEN